MERTEEHRPLGRIVEVLWLNGPSDGREPGTYKPPQSYLNIFSNAGVGPTAGDWGPGRGTGPTWGKGRIRCSGSPLVPKWQSTGLWNVANRGLWHVRLC